MGMHDVAGDREADTRALSEACCLVRASVEGLEYILEIRSGNANSIVRNIDLHGRFQDSTLHADPATMLRVFRRIADEVDHALGDGVRIMLYRR